MNNRRLPRILLELEFKIRPGCCVNFRGEGGRGYKDDGRCGEIFSNSNFLSSYCESVNKKEEYYFRLFFSNVIIDCVLFINILNFIGRTCIFFLSF